MNYFGLQFTNKKHQSRWIVLNKMMKKQLERNGANDGKDMLLLFKIHFFVRDAKILRQEITRYNLLMFSLYLADYEFLMFLARFHLVSLELSCPRYLSGLEGLPTLRCLFAKE